MSREPEEAIRDDRLGVDFVFKGLSNEIKLMLGLGGFLSMTLALSMSKSGRGVFSREIDRRILFDTFIIFHGLVPQDIDALLFKIDFLKALASDFRLADNVWSGLAKPVFAGLASSKNPA